MKPIKKIFDINAHIDNIICTINPEGDTTCALVSFNNLDYGIITAVKFNATGYNAFGDIVQINGKDKFFLIIQDIKIEKNALAKDIIIRLPHRDIRKIYLEECQICYEDGSVITYEGKNEQCIDTEEFEGSEGEERENFEALRDVVSSEIKYLPKETENGWLCGCGRYNIGDSLVCPVCNISKEVIFKISDPHFIEDAREKHKQNESERQEKASIEAKQKEKKKRKIILLTGLGVIVAIVLAIFIGHAIILSGRTTYPSAEKMKSSLQGTYTYYDSLGNASKQIIISGNTLTYRYRYTDDWTLTINEWDYRNGIIRTFEDLIVTKDGYIEDDGAIYRKGGYMSKPNSSTESGYSVLQITVDKVTSNSSYVICTGSVKNTGTKSYKFIKVKGSFKDSDGNVIDTDWTYAAGSEGLAPGESTTFRLSVPKNSKINSCTVSLLEYD